MNILFVAESFYPRARGGEIVLWRISCALSKRGHDVKVITSQLGDTPDHEIINGIEVFRPFRPGHIGRTTSFRHIYQKAAFNKMVYGFMDQFLQENEIDIIYNQAYPLTIAATRLGKKNRIPVIISVGSYQEINDINIRTIISDIIHISKQFIILGFTKYEAIRCGSIFIGDKLSKLTKKMIHTIATPVEDDYLRELLTSTDRSEVRNELGVLPGELFLLFVGALVPVKNLDGLISVLATLNRDFKLIVIGEGPEVSSIDQLIKNLRLDDRVIPVGTRDNRETLRIMSAADVVIVSSHLETCGNVVIEALSLGRPVISTRTGIAMEIESNNLFLVDNVEGINAVIERGIVPRPDPDTIERYSIGGIVESYETMFTKVLSEYKY